MPKQRIAVSLELTASYKSLPKAEVRKVLGFVIFISHWANPGLLIAFLPSSDRCNRGLCGIYSSGSQDRDKMNQD